MNQTRSAALITLLTAAAAGGCQADSALGSAGAPENYQVRAIDPRATVAQTVSLGDEAAAQPGTMGAPAQPLVLVTVGEGRIRNIAVTDDYLYFSAWWEGVYRIPKHGGDIEVIEAGAKNLFEPLATTHNEAFWVRMRFNDEDYPSVEVKHRPDSGGPIGVLFGGDWGITGPNGEDSNFQADASGVYMIAGPAGALDYHLFRAPAAGGALTRILTLSLPTWPTWLLDDGQLAYAGCDGGQQTCRLQTVATASPSDPPRVIASLPSSWTRLSGADALAYYLHDSEGIWKVSKSDGAITKLLATPSVHTMVVDDHRIYFTAYADSADRLRAIPTAGGPVEVVSDAGFTVLRQIVQDATGLYILHDDGRQISYVAKPVSPAPSPE
jgi:hypothetical protein